MIVKKKAIPKLVARKLSQAKPKAPPMTAESMLEIQAKLGLEWKAFCFLLGCSEANMKRWKYGYADIPRYIARYLTALVLVQEAGLLDSFERKCKKY